jgi:nitroreductase
MDVLTAILNRRSVRQYADRPIPPDVLTRLQQALRAAPSACNLQPWQFILVSGTELRRKVAKACHGQMWMADAPLIVAGCGLPGGAYKHMGGAGDSSAIDVTIAFDHLTLAAVAEGLGTCWIGAFEETAVKELLAVPADVKVVALTPLGYPLRGTLLHPLVEQSRKPVAEVFSWEAYGRRARM